jgi:hypothetical protein
MDFYGLFRDSQGRKLRFYSNERTTKYLFGMRYIPDNFDGVLLGSSITDNWDTKAIRGCRVYNASIAGSNISEQRLIAENIFARRKIPLAIFCIHPYLTATHGRKSGFMHPREYWGALGSIQLASEYASMGLVRMGKRKVECDDFGRYAFKVNAQQARVWKSRITADTVNTGSVRDPADGRVIPFNYVVDSAAVDEYRATLDLARANGARIIAFIPPFHAENYRIHREALRAYLSIMRSLFRPEERILDFNDPRYASWTEVHENFQDGSHLSPAAAAYFSSQLDSLVAAGR